MPRDISLQINPPDRQHHSMQARPRLPATPATISYEHYSPSQLQELQHRRFRIGPCPITSERCQVSPRPQALPCASVTTIRPPLFWKACEAPFFNHANVHRGYARYLTFDTLLSSLRSCPRSVLAALSRTCQRRLFFSISLMSSAPIFFPFVQYVRLPI